MDSIFEVIDTWQNFNIFKLSSFSTEVLSRRSPEAYIKS